MVKTGGGSEWLQVGQNWGGSEWLPMVKTGGDNREALRATTVLTRASASRAGHTVAVKEMYWRICIGENV